jgi:hypothetical protein
VFRVWVSHLEAGAEYFREGQWVWTPIPSSSIIHHPQARELCEEDLAALLAPFRVESSEPRPAGRGIRR